MADGGLSNVVTLLTDQVVVVLRSRCLIDAVVCDLVSEPLRSSVRLPSWADVIASSHGCYPL